ncbi:MAG: GTPase [Myxococcota bacterium]
MSEPLPLPELLRRCHRDELLPLAAVLDVNPHGLGVGTLAEVIARTLRRRGGHLIGNLLRGGEGPPYPGIVRDLAKRLDVSVTGETEDIERALLDDWMQRTWDALSPAKRALLAETLGRDLADRPPDAAELATRLDLRDRLPWRTGVATFGGGALRLLAGLFGPFIGVAAVLWLGRPQRSVLLSAVLEVARLRQVVRYRITVGVVGSPSSGKDAAIRAIFGVDSGNINPIAGSTRTVTITRLPSATALYVVNTPGMGDIVEEVTEAARQVLDHIDLFVYVLNAQGGVQRRERDDVQRCRDRGRPVLVVVNKIDTLRANDRERYLQDAQQKLDVADDDFLAAAFDPLPQLADAPIGVGAVRRWLRIHLVRSGKDPSELPWNQEEESP